MKYPSEKSLKILFARSANQCALPSCEQQIVAEDGTVLGEICHIKARRPGGKRYDKKQTDIERNAAENLILLCRNCHKLVDANPEEYSVEALHQIRQLHENYLARPARQSDEMAVRTLLNNLQINGDVETMVIDSPGVIIGKTINISHKARSAKISPPAGTIGSDQDATRYVAYLIGRYNDFASKDKGRSTKFNFSVISKNIEANFKARWQLVSMDQFSQVCQYLQQRIAKTRLAKSNTSKGIPSFRSFEDFLQK